MVFFEVFFAALLGLSACSDSGTNCAVVLEQVSSTPVGVSETRGPLYAVQAAPLETLESVSIISYSGAHAEVLQDVAPRRWTQDQELVLPVGKYLLSGYGLMGSGCTTPFEVVP